MPGRRYPRPPVPPTPRAPTAPAPQALRRAFAELSLERPHRQPAPAAPGRASCRSAPWPAGPPAGRWPGAGRPTPPPLHRRARSPQFLWTTACTSPPDPRRCSHPARARKIGALSTRHALPAAPTHSGGCRCAAPGCSGLRFAPAAARHLRSLPIPAPCALRLLVELDRPRVAGPATAGPALNRRRGSTLPPSPPGRRARPAIPPPAWPAYASSTDRARFRARYAVPSPSSASSDPTGSPARLRPAGQPPAERSARPALPPADGLAPGGLHLHPAPAAAPASPTTTRHPPTLPGVRRRRAAVAICAISFLYQNNIKMMVFR